MDRKNDSLARKVWKQIWRAVVAILGVGVLLAGVLMLALPGPGIAAIVAGLAILATEFKWARRWMRRIESKAKEFIDARKGAKRSKPNGSGDRH